jgi:hypothetical protein
MVLTPQQMDAVDRGEAVAVKIDQMDCVVLRKDVYQRMRQFCYDDGDWTDDELEQVALETFDGLDRPEKIRP